LHSLCFLFGVSEYVELLAMTPPESLCFPFLLHHVNWINSNDSKKKKYLANLGVPTLRLRNTPPLRYWLVPSLEVLSFFCCQLVHTSSFCVFLHCVCCLLPLFWFSCFFKLASLSSSLSHFLSHPIQLVSDSLFISTSNVCVCVCVCVCVVAIIWCLYVFICILCHEWLMVTPFSCLMFQFDKDLQTSYVSPISNDNFRSSECQMIVGNPFF